MFLSKQNPTVHHGITIIEVLTSIVVAMIGVFGVMVMIPFAVKQAQTGLDSDAATVVARNAFDQFEIGGFRLVKKNTTTGFHEFYWTANGTAKIQVENPPSAPNPPEVFFIDPLGITENGNAYSGTWPLANPTYAAFPFNKDIEATPLPFKGGGVFPNIGDLRIRLANLVVSPNGVSNPMDKASARRLFRAADDMVFGEAVDDLSGPQQIFDIYIDGGGVQQVLRRQANGGFSWAAMVVPVKADYSQSTGAGGWNYRMYILVFKNRSTAIDTVANPNEDCRMLVSRLDPSENTSVATSVMPLGTVYLTTGTQVVGLRKDDWVMLINRAEWDSSASGYPSGVTPAEQGFEKQIAFARVVNFADGSGTVLPSITLDGPDFNFGDPAKTFNPNNIISDTYIVHLKNVVGVYERTFTPEGASNWNISY